MNMEVKVVHLRKEKAFFVPKTLLPYVEHGMARIDWLKRCARDGAGEWLDLK
jgi:hypothetical protein